MHASDAPNASRTVRTLVLHPYVKQREHGLRTPDARLIEAVNLTQAIALEVVEARLVPLATPRPATLIGTGAVEQMQAFIADQAITLVVVDGTLSPIQQRNLEKAWQCKVIDRTALILEIFGARARTREGKLQVELAALQYQKSRLVRSWTHLERQRGGFGFLGGPGESQIEIDRRLIRDRIAKITRELQSVVRTRELQRKTRRDAPYPVVALVGYTNAGKSTLFNRLTGAGVMAENLLFATLDPTIRAVKLPGGMVVMLSDTVGFISELPTQLVAAFRATLEEVLEAEVIVHVRDISHADSDAQKQDVLEVLAALFGEKTPDRRPNALPDSDNTEAANTAAPSFTAPSFSERVIEVWNKIDCLDGALRDTMQPPADTPPTVAVSAVTGEGIERLLHHIGHAVSVHYAVTKDITLAAGEGKLLAWLHAQGAIITERWEEEQVRLTVRLTAKQDAQFARAVEDKIKIKRTRRG